MNMNVSKSGEGYGVGQMRRHFRHLSHGLKCFFIRISVIKINA